MLTMLSRFRPLSVTLALTLLTGAMPVYAAADAGSVVIGRLMGTLHEPPRSFVGNSPALGGGNGSVEFKGFRLVRDDGKTFVIRPLGDGYYQQSLPPGEYALTRKRTDRPSYREDKVIRILSFTVPEDFLVNLGTLGIVLEGKPEESLLLGSIQPTGKYTYRYRYERAEGEEALQAPLEWFREKETATAAAFGQRVATVNADPTGLVDSSRFTLKEHVFDLPLFRKR